MVLESGQMAGESMDDSITRPIDEEDCRYLLRSLELDAFASLVTAFRAQGALTDHKRLLLDHCRAALGVSVDRYRAEMHRVCADTLVNCVAKSLNPVSDNVYDWIVEGRPLLRDCRLEDPLPTTERLLADDLAKMIVKHNQQMPDKLHQLAVQPKQIYVPENVRTALQASEQEASRRRVSALSDLDSKRTTRPAHLTTPHKRRVGRPSLQQQSSVTSPVQAADITIMKLVDHQRTSAEDRTDCASVSSTSTHTAPLTPTDPSKLVASQPETSTVSCQTEPVALGAIEHATSPPSALSTPQPPGSRRQAAASAKLQNIKVTPRSRGRGKASTAHQQLMTLPPTTVPTADPQSLPVGAAPAPKRGRPFTNWETLEAPCTSIGRTSNSGSNNINVESQQQQPKNVAVVSNSVSPAVQVAPPPFYFDPQYSCARVRPFVFDPERKLTGGVSAAKQQQHQQLQSGSHASSSTSSMVTITSVSSSALSGLNTLANLATARHSSTPQPQPVAVAQSNGTSGGHGRRTQSNPSSSSTVQVIPPLPGSMLPTTVAAKKARYMASVKSDNNPAESSEHVLSLAHTNAAGKLTASLMSFVGMPESDAHPSSTPVVSSQSNIR